MKIMKTNDERPLISFGSFLLGVFLIACGMYATNFRYELGFTGVAAYWPTVAASVVASIVTIFSIFSPDGSIFQLVAEIFSDLRKN